MYIYIYICVIEINRWFHWKWMILRKKKLKSFSSFNNECKFEQMWNVYLGIEHAPPESLAWSFSPWLKRYALFQLERTFCTFSTKGESFMQLILGARVRYPDNHYTYVQNCLRKLKKNYKSKLYIYIFFLSCWIYISL